MIFEDFSKIFLTFFVILLDLYVLLSFISMIKGKGELLNKLRFILVTQLFILHAFVNIIIFIACKKIFVTLISFNVLYGYLTVIHFKTLKDG